MDSPTSVCCGCSVIQSYPTLCNRWIVGILSVTGLSLFFFCTRTSLWFPLLVLPQNVNVSFSSVRFSRSVMSNSLRPHESQHTRSPCPSPTAGVHSDSRPSSQWCCPAISSSVVPFSSLTYYNSLGNPSAFVAFNIVYMSVTPTSCLHMNLSSSQTCGSSCPPCTSSWMHIRHFKHNMHMFESWFNYPILS